MNDQNSRYARLRYTATGALAALAAVGAIAGTAALAANPRAKSTRPRRGGERRVKTKTPTPPVPGKTHDATAGLKPAVLDRRPAARR